METKTALKKFTLTQVFSIVDGRLSSDIGDVYDILNQVTGDNLMTHHLPTAMDYLKKVNPKWFVDLKTKIDNIKKVHGDDFHVLMDVIEKDKTLYDVPPLTKAEMKGYGEYMGDNSRLNRIGSKK